MTIPTDKPLAVPAFDYHTHHRRCGHAQGEMADYIEAGIALGLREIGVSDHCPFLFLPGDHPQPGTAMAASELPNYVAEARQLQERFAGRIAVRVGIEADFVPGFEDVYRETLAAHPLDYVLGSVHFVNGRHIFDRTRWADEDATATYTAYYNLVARAAASGMFDVMSHLTAVEAYGPPLPDALGDRLYPPVVEAVKASGCAVEVNTSGFRKMGDDDPFPNRNLLALLVAAGVPLTFGSDAHRPGEVGHARDRVARLLAGLGLDMDAPPRPLTVRRGPLLTFAS